MVVPATHTLSLTWILALDGGRLTVQRRDGPERRTASRCSLKGKRPRSMPAVATVRNDHRTDQPGRRGRSCRFESCHRYGLPSRARPAEVGAIRRNAPRTRTARHSMAECSAVAQLAEPRWGGSGFESRSRTAPWHAELLKHASVACWVFFGNAQRGTMGDDMGRDTTRHPPLRGGDPSPETSGIR